MLIKTGLLQVFLKLKQKCNHRLICFLYFLVTTPSTLLSHSGSTASLLQENSTTRVLKDDISTKSSTTKANMVMAQTNIQQI